MTTDQDRLRAMQEDASRTAEQRAAEVEAEEQRRVSRHADYVFDKSLNRFWDLRDRAVFEAAAVDASIPTAQWRVIPAPAREAGARGPSQRERLVKPSSDIMRIENDRFVESSTWWPGQPQIVKDFNVSGGVLLPAPGARLYNKFLPSPILLGGCAALAAPWRDHVGLLWPNPLEQEYLFHYCAHMIQRPGEKCNAGIVLSGTQGIGKDLTLEPVKRAVGEWNVANIDPDELFAPFKPWLESLMVVINEARPHSDEFRATSFYGSLKTMTAQPPTVLALNDKHLKLRYILNLMRVFITTNDHMAMHIPPEDRRLLIMHSFRAKGWAAAEYFEKYWRWLGNENGATHVAAFLRERDLRHFDPHAEPPMTIAKRSIQFSRGGNPEDPIGKALEAMIEKRDAARRAAQTAHGLRPVDREPRAPIFVTPKHLLKYSVTSDDQQAIKNENQRSGARLEQRMNAAGYVPVTFERPVFHHVATDHGAQNRTVRIKLTRVFVRRDRVEAFAPRAVRLTKIGHRKSLGDF